MSQDVLREAAQRTYEWLLSRARRDPEEREIVELLRDALRATEKEKSPR